MSGGWFKTDFAVGDRPTFIASGRQGTIDIVLVRFTAASIEVKYHVQTRKLGPNGELTEEVIGYWAGQEELE